jgi:hypothetical protein
VCLCVGGSRQRSHSEGPRDRTQSPGAAPGAPRGSSPSKHYSSQGAYNHSGHGGYGMGSGSACLPSAKSSSSFTALTESQGDHQLLDSHMQNMVVPSPVLSEPPPNFNFQSNSSYPSSSNLLSNPMFQMSYNPSRLCTPQPPYPPINGPRMTPPVYNPGPRQAMGRFSFDFSGTGSNNNRPRSRGVTPNDMSGVTVS